MNNQQTLSGQQLTRAPDWTATGGATYDPAVGTKMMLGFATDIRYNIESKSYC